MVQAKIEDALAIVGAETQADWVMGLINAVSTTQVTSRALIQPGASAGLFVGSWLLLPTREHYQRERVIEAYTPASGIVTFPSDALALATAVNESFQVWTRFRPTDVERALLRAMARMYRLRIDTLTGAAIGSLRQVDLTAAFGWLGSSNQILAITRLDGSLPNALEAPIGLDYVVATAQGDTLPHVLLNIQAPETFAAVDVLRVYTYSAWADDSPFTPASLPQTLASGDIGADAEWWAWEAIYMLGKQTQYRDPDLQSRAVEELNRLRAIHQPDHGYRMIEPREPWGPSGLMGM